MKVASDRRLNWPTQKFYRGAPRGRVDQEAYYNCLSDDLTRRPTDLYDCLAVKRRTSALKYLSRGQYDRNAHRCTYDSLILARLSEHHNLQLCTQPQMIPRMSSTPRHRPRQSTDAPTSDVSPESSHGAKNGRPAVVNGSLADC